MPEKKSASAGSPRLISFHLQGWEDYLYWQRTDKAMLRRINLLIDAIVREPFSGIGKPEPLRFELQGFWSRRIDDEHRLVYRMGQGQLIVVACRYHYR